MGFEETKTGIWIETEKLRNDIKALLRIRRGEFNAKIKTFKTRSVRYPRLERLQMSNLNLKTVTRAPTRSPPFSSVALRNASAVLGNDIIKPPDPALEITLWLTNLQNEFLFIVPTIGCLLRTMSSVTCRAWILRVDDPDESLLLLKIYLTFQPHLAETGFINLSGSRSEAVRPQIAAVCHRELGGYTSQLEQ
ncbi:hypothetical protein EVAR_101928_1 [Eumeta japonica]|uniref:Uncharacterized protein n=1 Tax=Eumeta variegata TaxID=151549 RepID=A0A4C1TSB3_EUMVA|nr:hypothetical protein EVAR_101928_1 [Eumeta japonica]